jgi:hypothetical protein
VREAEAQQKADQIRLEQDKALIEHSISELRAFEREYRLKIKTFIESQLADLDTSSTGPSTSPTPTSFLGLTEI